jgi:hypothetical protein
MYHREHHEHRVGTGRRWLSLCKLCPLWFKKSPDGISAKSM